jgi:hypothetical protein
MLRSSSLAAAGACSHKQQQLDSICSQQPCHSRASSALGASHSGRGSSCWHAGIRHQRLPRVQACRSFPKRDMQLKLTELDTQGSGSTSAVYTSTSMEEPMGQPGPGASTSLGLSLMGGQQYSLLAQLSDTRNVNNLRKFVHVARASFWPRHYRAALARLSYLVDEEPPVDPMDRQHVQSLLESLAEVGRWGGTFPPF